LLLVLLLLGKARFLGGEPRDLWRAGSCAEETKSIRRLPEKNRSDQRCAMGKWMKGLIGMKQNLS
jgi:hypothetical protein